MSAAVQAISHTWRDDLAEAIAAEAGQADEDLAATRARVAQAVDRYALAQRDIAEFNSTFGTMAAQLRMRGGDLSPVLLRFSAQLDAEAAAAKAEAIAAGSAVERAEKCKSDAAAAAAQLAAVMTRPGKHAA